MSVPLRGRTLRWTFRNGPVAGKTYEHTFNDDGSVEYRHVGAAKGAPTREKECATVSVSDDVSVISYLAGSGYTLTAVLNFRTKEVVAFASNDKGWFRQDGTFDLVDGGA
jgi:molybdenum cofactor biosynthesis protein MoaF